MVGMVPSNFKRIPKISVLKFIFVVEEEKGKVKVWMDAYMIRAPIDAVRTSWVPSRATKRALRIMVDFIIIGSLGQYFEYKGTRRHHLEPRGQRVNYLCHSI